MKISQLTLKQFRNYSHLQLDIPAAGLVLLGPNGCGKTNILEAIYYFRYGKSFHAGQEAEVIQFEKNGFEVRGKFIRNNEPVAAAVRFQKKEGKFIELNFAVMKRIQDFIGNLFIFYFAPSDIAIVQGAPGIRRKFLDLKISEFDKVYLQALNAYGNALKQRNAALKAESSDAQLWKLLNRDCAQHAAIVLAKRLAFLQRLQEKINFYYPFVMGQNREIQLTYHASLPVSDEGPIEAELEKKYHSNLSYERKIKSTISGPHRDDFFIKMDGIDSKTFSSQGQQRIIVLLLKLAAANILKELKQEAPILLLDDILGDLDKQKKERLIRLIQQEAEQIIWALPIADEYLAQFWETCLVETL